MNLERSILEVLVDLAGHLTTCSAVQSHVGLSTGKPETLGDVTAALQALERKGQVIGIDHEDYGHRWRITDEGKARLRE
jgi:hypothetical protein